MDPDRPEHGEPSFQSFHVDPMTPPPPTDQPMWPGAQPMSPAPYMQQQPPPAPPAPRRTGLAAFWNHPVVIACIMGTLVLLVTALTVITVVALKKDSPADNAADDRGNQTTGPAPTRGPTTDPGAGAGSGSGQNETTPSAPASADNDTSAAFLNGHLTMNLFGGESGDSVDLDTAKKAYSFGNDEKPDMTIGSTALNMKSKAKVHKSAGTGTPTQTGCTAGAQWADSAHVSTLATDVVLCVQTSDGRIGALSITAVNKNDDGRLSSVEFDYVIWKKSGDQ